MDCELGKGSGETAGSLKRQIGLLGGVAMIVGSMIGSGIFISPGNLVKHTDSVWWSLIVWVGCGVFTIMMSFCYMELGTLIQKSGGELAYFQATYKPLHRFIGEIPGFLFSWLHFTFLLPAALAVNCTAFGQYVLEPLMTYGVVNAGWKDDLSNDVAEKGLAILCAVMTAAINIRSVKAAEGAQIGLAGCKLLAMFIIIGVGISYVAKNGIGDKMPSSSHFDYGSSPKLGDLAVAAYSGFWSYSGWQNVNYLTEELVNPKRNLPLAILIAVPFVMVMYVLVNLAYVVILGKDALIGAHAVAVESTSATLGQFQIVIPILVALSTLGSSNVGQFVSGRIIYASSSERHLPQILSYLHPKYCSPIGAIVCNTILATLFICLASSIHDLIDLFGFVVWAFYALALACVIVLRYTQPDAPRIIKVPIALPVVCLAGAVFLFVAPIIQNSSYGYLLVLLAVIVGLILYTVFICRKASMPLFDKLEAKLEHLLSKLTLQQ